MTERDVSTPESTNEGTSWRAIADQLAAALSQLEGWDMLSLWDDGTGTVLGDAPWARSVIRAALARYREAAGAGNEGS